MKFKKIILIPVSVLGLGVLFSCGAKKSTAVFSGLTNGYESVEFEKYLKLPSNLRTIEQGYGEYINENASAVSFATVTSLKTKNLEVGTAPFFRNVKIDTNPGEMHSDIKNEYSVFRSPFSSNASKREAETEINYHRSETNPVFHQKETSIRSDYDAISDTVIKNEPTDYEEISYTVKNLEKYEPYRLHKGYYSKESTKDVEYQDVAYKTKIEDDSYGTGIECINGIAGQVISEHMDNVIYLTLSEAASIENLGYGVFIGGVRADAEDNLTYLSNGNDTIYAYSSISSEDCSVPVADNSEKTVKAFQTKTKVIEIKYSQSAGGWLFNNATSASKVYVKADENGKAYSKPRCLCSEYRHIDLSYNDLGDFGPIEDAELYNTPNFMVGYKLNNLVPGADCEEIDSEFNSLMDQNMYINGGVYDHTFTARKAGIIENNEYLYYGTINLTINKFKLKNGTGEVDSPKYSVDFDLRRKDDTVPLPASDDTVDEKLKPYVTAEGGKIIVNFIGDTNSAPATRYHANVDVYIKVLEQDGDFQAEEFSITEHPDVNSGR